MIPRYLVTWRRVEWDTVTEGQAPTKEEKATASDEKLLQGPRGILS